MIFLQVDAWDYRLVILLSLDLLLSMCLVCAYIKVGCDYSFSSELAAAVPFVSFEDIDDRNAGMGSDPYLFPISVRVYPYNCLFVVCPIICVYMLLSNGCLDAYAHIAIFCEVCSITTGYSL